MSPCNPLYGPDRRFNGFICTSGEPDGAKRRCVFCGNHGAPLLCDGPGPQPETTCDAAICDNCSIGIRALDVDFCPACAGMETPEPCAVFAGVRADPCSGPLLPKGGVWSEQERGTCLKHEFLFDHWLKEGGWEQVYSRSDLSREQKRLRFKNWLATEEGATRIAAFLGFLSRFTLRPRNPAKRRASTREGR